MTEIGVPVSASVPKCCYIWSALRLVELRLTAEAAAGSIASCRGGNPCIIAAVERWLCRYLYRMPTERNHAIAMARAIMSRMLGLEPCVTEKKKAPADTSVVALQDGHLNKPPPGITQINSSLSICQHQHLSYSEVPGF